MRARLAGQPVRFAIPRRGIILVAVLALLCGGLVLAVGLARPARLLGGSSLPYGQRVSALRARHAASVGKLDDLLSQRDANPTLVQNVAWKHQFSGVADELSAQYAELHSATPPAGAQVSHACLENAFRLTADGASLLVQGFDIDGHGAYFFGSHGNWDLYLGHQALSRCGGS
ncbi:MAG TPA: hypothetical protein VFZ25_04230 [Chloroflexota bacterium]|nr:hypothetical protein [Chloroflexota bacterium]